jgi:hypothetical protein
MSASSEHPGPHVFMPFYFFSSTSASSPPSIANEAFMHGFLTDPLTINDSCLMLVRHIVNGDCYFSTFTACAIACAHFPNIDDYLHIFVFSLLLSPSASHELQRLVCTSLGVADSNRYRAGPNDNLLILCQFSTIPVHVQLFNKP